MRPEKAGGGGRAAPVAVTVTLAGASDSRVGRWMTAAIEAEPWLEVTSYDGDELAIMAHPPAGRHPPPGGGTPPSAFTIALGASAAPCYHGAWIDGAAGSRQGWRIADAPTNAVLDVLAVLPPARHVQATVIAPAGTGSAALDGPIDSLIFDDSAACPPPPWPHGATWSRQTVTAPQTRCWIVALAVTLAESITLDDVGKALDDAGRVLLLPATLGLDGSGALTEFFRDLGRPEGEFAEAVVFAHEMRCADGRLQLWIAAHGLNQVAEAFDCMRSVASPPPRERRPRAGTVPSRGRLRRLSSPLA